MRNTRHDGIREEYLKPPRDVNALDPLVGHFLFIRMSNKRAREEEEDTPPHAAESTGDNAFVSWLIPKIYTYAEVRDSDELRRTQEELRIRTRAYKKLLCNVLSGDVAYPFALCATCGNIDKKLQKRPKCGWCTFSPIHCSVLPWCSKPMKCGSGKHFVCDNCPAYRYTDCTGTDEKKCTITTGN